MTPAQQHFHSQVGPWINRFRNDMKCGKYDAVAVFGNSGQETLGWTKLQEMKPIVPGSRGGYGWMQWTGARRLQFERFCATRGYKTNDFEANYQFLLHELRNTPEGKAMRAMFAKVSLDDKVVAFEQNFLRAHKDYKHYDSRRAWAKIALDAYEEYLDANPGLSTRTEPAPAIGGGTPPVTTTPTPVNGKALVAGGALAGLVALAYAIWQGVIGG